MGLLAVWAMVFGSEFLILEVIDLGFGGPVEPGGFLMVIAIVATMMWVRELVNRVYLALGGEKTAGAGWSQGSRRHHSLCGDGPPSSGSS